MRRSLVQGVRVARGASFERTTASELNEIDPRTLRPTVTIPAETIANALKSSEGRKAPLNTYENASGIEGLWTEFYFEGHWYMVGVSHIDLPARISSSELDMLADEFLAQQGNMKRRRRFRWRILSPVFFCVRPTVRGSSE
jgi:hypothetical protein